MNRETPDWEPPIWLASRSPRRRDLLTRAGAAVEVRPPGVDDGRLIPPPEVNPAHWVMAMAWLKAAWVAEQLPEPRGVVLAADTICVHDDVIIGQPRDRDHARAMLDAMRDGRHVTMTGLCLLCPRTAERRLIVDLAVVDVGAIPDDELDAYLDSEEWRGKAGGYNLEDRLHAGWPIECDGDPASVMGLPMQKLEPLLQILRKAG